MKYAIAVILFLGFFILNFLVIDDYGLNWDEPNHYFRGQAYLRFMLTGKRNYDDLPRLRFHYPKNNRATPIENITYDDDSEIRRSIYQYDLEDGQNPYDYYRDSVPSHPPINGLLASFSNYIFYQTVGILGDIESYHLFIVFASALLVATVFLFVSEVYSKTAGLVAALALTTYPLFLGESHNNIKDPVEATFFTLFLYFYYKGIIKEKFHFIIIASIFAGLALGTKFNILFAPFIVAPWLFFYLWNKKRGVMSLINKKVLLSNIIVAIIAFSILYLSWPHLWHHPFGLLQVFDYYGDIGYGTTYQPAQDILLGLINTYAIKWILYTTPLVTLFLFLVGVIYVFVKGKYEKNKFSFLILFWFLMTILRVSIPQVGIYGGVRQIMEYVPAMAILAGIGANYLVQSLKFKIFSASWRIKLQLLTFIFELLIILSFTPITLKLISIHPNESVYFNPLIGGLKGAKEKNFTDWGITLGNQYQQGIDWLNTHAEYNADVALVKGLLTNVPRVKIRKDINFAEHYYSGPQKNGEYLMEVVDYHWDVDVPKEKRDYIETLLPVYEVDVDGVPILYIWKNDIQHTKK